jgi:hypothetical protein
VRRIRPISHEDRLSVVDHLDELPEGSAEKAEPTTEKPEPTTEKPEPTTATTASEQKS